MKHFQNTQSFHVTYGHHNHMELTAYVENGKVCKIHSFIGHYLHGSYSCHTYALDDDSFESELKKFIRTLYKNS